MDYRVRALCLRPYPGHPQGCPNYGRRLTCPPGVGLFDRVFDLSQPVFAVVGQFDLESHMVRMCQKHPHWTERQLRNCRYWQGTARKALRLQLASFLATHPGYSAATAPEAMGVEVTATLRRAGVELEWPVRRVARQVALCAIPLNRSSA
ncbi:MAG: hypothetical protein AB1445_11030 [Bacillota bacterium]